MTKRWLVIFTILFSISTSVAAFERFVVSDIRLEGLERIADGTLLNYLPIQVGDPVDEQQTAYALRQLYKTGFFKDVQLARDGDVLVVKVVERPAIADVKFTGNNDIVIITCCDVVVTAEGIVRRLNTVYISMIVIIHDPIHESMVTEDDVVAGTTMNLIV